MHYRQYAFSKNRKPTILPKRPVPYLRCRGIDCPSELDIKKINFLYKCHKKDDYDEDKHFDNFNDKEIDNEVNVDEILVGSKGSDGDSFEDHFNPDTEEDNEPCLDEECLRANNKRAKAQYYTGPIGSYGFNRHQYPRAQLMGKLFYSGKRKATPMMMMAKHPLIPVAQIHSPLISSYLDLY